MALLEIWSHWTKMQLSASNGNLFQVDAQLRHPRERVIKKSLVRGMKKHHFLVSHRNYTVCSCYCNSKLKRRLFVLKNLHQRLTLMVHIEIDWIPSCSLPIGNLIMLFECQNQGWMIDSVLCRFDFSYVEVRKLSFGHPVTHMWENLMLRQKGEPCLLTS